MVIDRTNISSKRYLILGATITEKWNTDNLLGTVIEVKDQFARGLKLTVDTSYTPHTAKRDAVVKSEWANDNTRVILLMKTPLQFV